MEILSIAVSSVFIIILVKKIIYNIIFPEYCEKKKWELIEKDGYYKLLQKISASIAFTVFFFLFSYRFAKYSTFWLILAILFAVVLLVTLLMVSRKAYKDSKKMRSMPENNDREIQARRLSSILYITILVMWVLSWKHLLE